MRNQRDIMLVKVSNHVADKPLIINHNVRELSSSSSEAMDIEVNEHLRPSSFNLSISAYSEDEVPVIVEPVILQSPSVEEKKRKQLLQQ
jgi:hypothetical protein